MSLGAALLPLWPRVEFLGVERVPRPPAPAVHRLQHQWELISSVWRCRVCLLGSLSKCQPEPGGCRGHSRLDSAVLDRLGHKVIALACSDDSFLFTCLHCRSYSSGAQVKKLGQVCQPPTVTGHKNWRNIQKGSHPDKPH
eukprot:8228865-Pyramimonas_sp.AAC.1